MFGHQETNEEEKDHEVVELYQVLQAPLDLDTPPDEDEVRLPRHERCAAHTLNLVATADAEQALEYARYKRIFSRVLTVCKTLGTKQQHSFIASEVLKRHLGRFLLVPCPTRWNSLYKALHQIRQQGSNINKLLDSLNISRILGDDLIFLQEYTSPVAKSLDILQGLGCKHQPIKARSLLFLARGKCFQVSMAHKPAGASSFSFKGQLREYAGTPVYRKQGPKWCVASPGRPRRVQTYPGLGSTTRMPFSLDTGSPRTATRGYDPEFLQEVAASGRSVVNVWGAVSYQGLGSLHRIEGRLTSENYCNILDDVCFPMLSVAHFLKGIFLSSKTSPQSTPPANCGRSWRIIKSGSCLGLQKGPI
ncbi:uncharacterized protein ISCGN_031373 [Ixodes scapularis]